MDAPIIRDPYEMEKFADNADTYAELMKQTCENIKAGMYAAAPMMKDRTSQKARHRIDQLCDELLSGLPMVYEASSRLRAAAKPLKDVVDIM